MTAPPGAPLRADATAAGRRPNAQGPLRWLLLLLLCAFAGVGTAAPTEYDVKAAFLYKFCLYAEWPAQAFADADTPFVIGIVGPHQLAARVRKIVESRAIAGRPVAVRHIGTTASAGGSHLLFVAQSEHARMRPVITASEGQPVLLVTESDDGLDAGSVINFVVVNGRVRFEVAPEAAKQRGVRLSAQLLRVARTVREEGAR